MSEFDIICNQYPNAERIYHERSKKDILPDLLQFKEDIMSWKDFYNRILNYLNIELGKTIVNIQNGNHTNEEINKLVTKLITDNRLMELKIIDQKVFPNISYTSHHKFLAVNNPNMYSFIESKLN